MKQILLVEDETEYREVLADLIRGLGVGVIEAQNGKVALDILKKEKADLILLDLLMPIMDGKSFLTHFKKTSHQKTPVIILTNLSADHIPEGLPFIMKAEIRLTDLLRTIQNKLDEVVL